MPETWHYKDKAALVTGGAKRIGLAVIEALAGRGVRVVLHYRSSRAEAEAAADRLRAAGGQVWTLQADLADPTHVQRLFTAASKAAGPIDILIHTASIFPE